MEFCLEDNHIGDEMSAASSCAYSETYSDEMISVDVASSLSSYGEDLKTAIEQNDDVFKTPLNEAISPASNLTHENMKTAEMDVSVYTPPHSETDVDMERDVVGEASPISTAVTGSISWYSLPPSETAVEYHLKNLSLRETLPNASENKDSKDDRQDSYEFNTALEA
ncbi:hypothetical protein DICVIV_02115 [Dictyocaulus viviparus]|uniref:Uncharacterized protein n=1 Tax=Dictyocaulus viviparus TaxID=29172 RepID=A0A0D8Y6V4_DICVI|nr:hypothetical protein DICVIV_02115 [Dictyocaulus viviparus]